MRATTRSVQGLRRCEIIACALLAAACEQPAGANDDARITVLESKVQKLAEELRGPAKGGAASASFDIACPTPWEQLGPVGDAAWTCRAPQPLPNGLWPNCNVTEGAADRDARPKQTFEASLASVPQLRSARRIADRASALAGVPAHEAIYEHDLLSKPLRVLATLAVRSGRAYAVSCASSPEAFAANEPVFRQITESFRWRP